MHLCNEPLNVIITVIYYMLCSICDLYSKSKLENFVIQKYVCYTTKYCFIQRVSTFQMPALPLPAPVVAMLLCDA